MQSLLLNGYKSLWILENPFSMDPQNYQRDSNPLVDPLMRVFQFCYYDLMCFKKVIFLWFLYVVLYMLCTGMLVNFLYKSYDEPLNGGVILWRNKWIMNYELLCISELYYIMTTHISFFFSMASRRAGGGVIIIGLGVTSDQGRE